MTSGFRVIVILSTYFQIQDMFVELLCKSSASENHEGLNLRNRLTVKKDRGRKMIVTTVKTRMALLFDSAMIASSFCSIVRSWKSCTRRIRKEIECMDQRQLPRLMNFSNR